MSVDSTPFSVEARRLGPDDTLLGVDAIRQLKALDGYPTPSAEELSTFLSRADNVLIVATIAGVPVGYVVAYLLDRVDCDQRMMFFYEIGVAEAHRRLGARMSRRRDSMRAPAPFLSGTVTR